MSDELLNERELADELGISTKTLQKWRTAGIREVDRGPVYVKVGGSVRYRRSDVDAWLTAHTVRRETTA